MIFDCIPTLLVASIIPISKDTLWTQLHLGRLLQRTTEVLDLSLHPHVHSPHGQLLALPSQAARPFPTVCWLSPIDVFSFILFFAFFLVHILFTSSAPIASSISSLSFTLILRPICLLSPINTSPFVPTDLFFPTSSTLLSTFLPHFFLHFFHTFDTSSTLSTLLQHFFLHFFLFITPYSLFLQSQFISVPTSTFFT